MAIVEAVIVPIIENKAEIPKIKTEIKHLGWESRLAIVSIAYIPKLLYQDQRLTRRII